MKIKKRRSLVRGGVCVVRVRAMRYRILSVKKLCELPVGMVINAFVSAPLTVPFVRHASVSFVIGVSACGREWICDAIQDVWNEYRACACVEFVEFLAVGVFKDTVVDAHDERERAVALHERYDLLEVAECLGDRQSLQDVVAAEENQHDVWVVREYAVCDAEY